MINIELITTIISIALRITGSVLAYLAKKNDKAKKHYETFIDIENRIKSLMVDAEGYYKNGDQKKKYVLSSSHAFLSQNNINISDEQLNIMIETVISLTKTINNK